MKFHSEQEYCERCGGNIAIQDYWPESSTVEEWSCIACGALGWRWKKSYMPVILDWRKRARKEGYQEWRIREMEEDMLSGECYIYTPQRKTMTHYSVTLLSGKGSRSSNSKNKNKKKAQKNKVYDGPGKEYMET